MSKCYERRPSKNFVKWANRRVYQGVNAKSLNKCINNLNLYFLGILIGCQPTPMVNCSFKALQTGWNQKSAQMTQLSHLPSRREGKEYDITFYQAITYRYLVAGSHALSPRVHNHVPGYQYHKLFASPVNVDGTQVSVMPWIEKVSTMRARMSILLLVLVVAQKWDSL